MEGGGMDQAGLSPRLLTFLWERRLGCHSLSLPRPVPGCSAVGGHLLCWARGGRGEAGMDVQVRMPQVGETQPGKAWLSVVHSSFIAASFRGNIHLKERAWPDLRPSPSEISYIAVESSSDLWLGGEGG